MSDPWETEVAADLWRRKPKRTATARPRQRPKKHGRTPSKAKVPAKDPRAEVWAEIVRRPRPWTWDAVAVANRVETELLEARCGPKRAQRLGKIAVRFHEQHQFRRDLARFRLRIPTLRNGTIEEENDQ